MLFSNSTTQKSNKFEVLSDSSLISSNRLNEIDNEDVNAKLIDIHQNIIDYDNLSNNDVISVFTGTLDSDVRIDSSAIFPPLTKSQTSFDLPNNMSDTLFTGSDPIQSSFLLKNNSDTDSYILFGGLRKKKYSHNKNKSSYNSNESYSSNRSSSYDSGYFTDSFIQKKDNSELLSEIGSYSTTSEFTHSEYYSDNTNDSTSEHENTNDSTNNSDNDRKNSYGTSSSTEYKYSYTPSNYSNNKSSSSSTSNNSSNNSSNKSSSTRYFLSYE